MLSKEITGLLHETLIKHYSETNPGLVNAIKTFIDKGGSSEKLRKHFTRRGTYSSCFTAAASVVIARYFEDKAK